MRFYEMIVLYCYVKLIVFAFVMVKNENRFL